MDQKRQRRQEEGRSEQGRARSRNYNRIICRYQFACVISLLNLACMVHACVVLVLLMSLAWVFPSVIVVFSLAFPFLDNHGVMGSLLFGYVGFLDGFETE